MPTIEEKISFLSGFLTARRVDLLEEVLSHRTDALTIVLEDVYHAQNISAAIRTAECFGIQNVHIVEDLHSYEVNPRIVKGSTKWVNLHHYHPTDDEGASEACINQLKKDGYKIYATSPNASSIALDDLTLTEKSAFIFGTELTGVTQSVTRLADQTIHLPMVGFTESFNISVTVALILQHVKRKLEASGYPMELSEERKEQVRFDWYQKAVKNATQLLERYCDQ